jgi:DNA-binding CsgD family transcriptional regulator
MVAMPSRSINPDPESHLTPRQREVYQLLLAALSDKEIASAMGITGHTVRYHIQLIFRKLGVDARTQLFLPFVKG